MTRNAAAEPLQLFAEILEAITERKREAFVQRCLLWDSAGELADDLAAIGLKIGERQCAHYRARQFKKRPAEVDDALKLIIERRKVAEARSELARLERLIG